MTAPGIPDVRSLRPGPRRLFVFLLIMNAAAIVVALVGGVVRRYFVDYYRVYSVSMEPTFVEGDVVLVRKRFRTATDSTSGLRGAVVIIDRDGARPSIKRVAGVGGDTLMMRDGVLFRDGRLVESACVPYARAAAYRSPAFDWQFAVAPLGSRFGRAPRAPSSQHWGPLVVPPGALFVLGDNREQSVDSRSYGFIQADHVEGVATRHFRRWREHALC